MTASPRPRPTLLQALVPTGAGCLILLFGLQRAIGGVAGPADAAQLWSLLAVSIGALLFAVGLMMLLVVVFRPFFGKRRQDEGTESPPPHP